jgi:lipoprotein-anchoring transpeptidase ErfK/SrfK
MNRRYGDNTRYHGGVAAAVLLLIGILAGSGLLLADTLRIRYERDVTRMVFNDNVGLLENIRNVVGYSSDSLSHLLATPSYVPAADRPYIVISIKENKLWYRQGDSLLMETEVATGSGKTLVQEGDNKFYKFDTPRGRLVVERKDIDPSWVPPDWHYEEQARKKGISAVPLLRGEPIRAADGTVLTVSGNDVVMRTPSGTQKVMQATDGREIVFDGKMVIPPFGTNQRKYTGVLGTRRLYLGDGYGIHGTNDPSSIGRSVSHGCVRMRNEDIERLFDMVKLGTPVFIY